MSGRPAFKVHTSQVQPSGSDFTFEIEPGWIEQQLSDAGVQPATEGGTVQVNLSPISPGFWLQGDIHVTLKVQCLRCLRMTRLQLHQPFKVHMQPGPPTDEFDDESYSEDGHLGVHHFQGEEMVLDNLVRESIVLALPMSPRCPEGCTVEDLYREED